MTHSNQVTSHGYLHSLDGLRALSIGLVLLGHLAGTVGAPAFLNSFHSLGNYGVRFFFVISGFLITWLLLRELKANGSVDLIRFFFNRSLRIFPAFYAYITVGAVLSALGWITLQPGDLLHAATYTMNYQENRAWFFNHTWSLAVEEQFYLLWPLALLFLGPRRAPWLLVALILSAPAIRAVMWFGFDASPTAMMRQFQAVADALAIGCSMAFLLEKKPNLYQLSRRIRIGLSVAAVSLFLGSAASYLIAPVAFYIAGQSAANLAAALTIYLCITMRHGPLRRFLNWRPIVFMGVLSYSLYLWQEPFLDSNETGLVQSYPLNLILTFVMALLSYHLIEAPFRKLKTHYEPLRSFVTQLLRTRRGVPLRFWVVFICLIPSALLASGSIGIGDSKLLHLMELNSAKPVYLDSELQVSGTLLADTNGTLVIRIDDQPDASFTNRINIERRLPPGPFQFTLSMGGLKTASGRPIKPGAIKSIRIFTNDTDLEWVSVTSNISTRTSLGFNATGWDFGPEHSAVMPGFASIHPGSPHVAGQKLTAISRQGPDALARDGIRGIERFEAPIPNGLWRVTLWTEDYGEWQSLPYWTKRQIAINGKSVSKETLSAEAWLRTRYLIGAQKEAVLDGNAWDLIGARRGGIVQSVVWVRDERLQIDLSGDMPTARFLSGVLAEPVESSAAYAAVRASQRSHFTETWRTATPEASITDVQVDLGSSSRTLPSQIHLQTAPGGADQVDFWLSAHAPEVPVVLELSHDLPSGIDIDLRQGLWQFGRDGAASTLLRAHSDRLSKIDAPLRLHHILPRRISMSVFVRKAVQPGTYPISLKLRQAETETIIPIALRVISQKLPIPSQKVGTYLEEAPHLSWFGHFANQRRGAIDCDLTLLRKFGLTTLAPPFTHPKQAFTDRHVDIIGRANNHGFEGPLQSYASVKWHLASYGEAATVRAIAETTDRLKQSGLPPIAWSITDEPSNPGGQPHALEQIADAIRDGAPGALLLGHLNNPKDWEYVNLFDIAVVNDGFGADVSDMQDIHRADVTPWLYNLSNPRMAAGFYLWRSGAEGYLQWHARMPTADPFDPTDGREDDFQLIYPDARGCMSADIDADLLSLSRGMEDLRWLTWLDEAAKKNADAKNLKHRLLGLIPTTWVNASKVDASQLDIWRREVQQIAIKPALSHVGTVPVAN